MTSRVFINLAIEDLDKSMAFFSQLGFSFNAQFTNDQAACMVINDSVCVMLLKKEFFQGFTKKTISDATKTTEVLVALSLASREAVDEMVTKAVEAGGRIYNEPQDHGFMYAHSFEDLDGHQWEPFFMDENHIQ